MANLIKQWQEEKQSQERYIEELKSKYESIRVIFELLYLEKPFTEPYKGTKKMIILNNKTIEGLDNISDFLSYLEPMLNNDFITPFCLTESGMKMRTIENDKAYTEILKKELEDKYIIMELRKENDKLKQTIERIKILAIVKKP